MSKLKEFLVRKDIVISPQRYLIDALGAMAQGLFASLLIGTIIKTVGQQTGLALLVVRPWPVPSAGHCTAPRWCCSA